MLPVTSPLGPVLTKNPMETLAHIDECVSRDCYRLRDIAKVFRPTSFFDIGTAAGEVSMLAHDIWPSAAIIGFEENNNWAECYAANNPFSMLVKASIGYGLRGPDLLNTHGHPDLLKIDCEGGEVPFFYDCHRHGYLSSFKVIVGEWHGWAGRTLLEYALRELFDYKFIDPLPGAGPWHNFFAVRRLDYLKPVKEVLID